MQTNTNTRNKRVTNDSLRIISEIDDVIDSADENCDSGFQGEPGDIVETNGNVNKDNNKAANNVDTVSQAVTANVNNIRDVYSSMICLPVGYNLQNPTPMYDPSLLMVSEEALAPAIARASESVYSGRIIQACQAIHQNAQICKDNTGKKLSRLD